MSVTRRNVVFGATAAAAAVQARDLLAKPSQPDTAIREKIQGAKLAHLYGF